MSQRQCQFHLEGIFVLILLQIPPQLIPSQLRAWSVCLWKQMHRAECKGYTLLCAGARKFTARPGTSSAAWESLATLAHGQGVSQENREPPRPVSTGLCPLCVPCRGRHGRGTGFGCRGSTGVPWELLCSPAPCSGMAPRDAGPGDPFPPDPSWERMSAWNYSQRVCRENTRGGVFSCLCWKRGKYSK